MSSYVRTINIYAAPLSVADALEMNRIGLKALTHRYPPEVWDTIKGLRHYIDAWEVEAFIEDMDHSVTKGDVETVREFFNEHPLLEYIIPREEPKRKAFGEEAEFIQLDLIPIVEDGAFYVSNLDEETEHYFGLYIEDCRLGMEHELSFSSSNFPQEVIDLWNAYAAPLINQLETKIEPPEFRQVILRV